MEIVRVKGYKYDGGDPFWKDIEKVIYTASAAYIVHIIMRDLEIKVSNHLFQMRNKLGIADNKWNW